jgi:ribosomal protein L7/L12
MGPTQRKLADLQNSVDDISSCLRIFESRIAGLEEKDIPGAKTFKGTIPPQQLDTTEVVKAICHSYKHVERRVKISVSPGLISYKIEAIKLVRALTNLGLLPSKQLVDKYWEAST